MEGELGLGKCPCWLDWDVGKETDTRDFCTSDTAEVLERKNQTLQLGAHSPQPSDVVYQNNDQKNLAII